MPTYDLQYETANGKVDCGKVLISTAGESVSINYLAKGKSGNGVAIPNATYTDAGGGTATSPNPGDLLNLAGYRVTVGTTQCQFDGDGVFQNAQGSQKKGYYRAELAGDQGDWDASDGGGGNP
jgi:hypothetical protein